MKDEARFNEWWSDVSPRIRRSTAAIVGSESQDIAQDVSVMAVLRFDEFDTLEDFRRWCHKRSNWLALDELARRRRFTRDSKAVISELWSVDIDSNLGVLHKLIGELPKQQRSVTVDKIDGYLTTEIATRHQIATSTVRSLWRYAKQNLVKMIEDDNNET
jgi:DNA-directed RNA polymerase specialized sigma24 family protein